MAAILVVEDERIVACDIEEALLALGYDVVGTASSADECWTAVARRRPDLVLMDVVLPGQNGYQATRTLAKDEATKNIPVIIVSTKGQETDRVWGMRQGAREYIVKPVSPADLLAKISALG